MILEITQQHDKLFLSLSLVTRDNTIAYILVLQTHKNHLHDY